MNYFYFRQFLLDLITSKYIIGYTNDNNEEIYELTPLGKETLALVKDLIPGITKFKIDSEFKTTLTDIENTLSISADFVPVSETEYSVTCKIIENNKILFE
jgi:DNA-binding PadR family transcriptional regulator